MAKILVTGAYGYIGSHVVKTAAEHGHVVTALDMRYRENEIRPYVNVIHICDLCDVDSFIDSYDAVLHLAAFIDVAESTQYPMHYYQNNIMSTWNLINKTETDNFIFASTGAASNPTSPYAISKLACEDIINRSYKNRTNFRFFNVAGANGFRQLGRPTHLVRIAARVANGFQDKLTIYGDDYDTEDGTCIREYVHVQSIADAMVKAIEKPSENPYENLSNGKPTSNLDVLKTMQKVTKNEFNWEFGPRRIGDPAILFADIVSPYMNDNKYTLEDMCKSAYEMEKLDYA